MLTDIGIELGRLSFIDRAAQPWRYAANRSTLCVQGALVTSFFLGGLIGAFGFKWLGFMATVPLAALLVAVVARVVVHEVHFAIPMAASPRPAVTGIRAGSPSE